MVINTVWLNFRSSYDTGRAKGRLKKAGLLTGDWHFYSTTLVLDFDEPVDFNEVTNYINKLMEVAKPLSVSLT